MRNIASSGQELIDIMQVKGPGVTKKHMSQVFIKQNVEATIKSNQFNLNVLNNDMDPNDVAVTSDSALTGKLDI